MTLICKRKGYEIWAAFDESAQVWELFFDADGVSYAGCADTIREAKMVAKFVLNEVAA